MHHADQHADMVEQQSERLVDDAGGDQQPVDRPVLLEQQHPGEGAHQHADPQRQQHRGEEQRLGAASEPGEGEGEREGEDQRHHRHHDGEGEGVDEDLAVDVVADELGIGGEASRRRAQAEADQLHQRHQEGTGEEQHRRQEEEERGGRGALSSAGRRGDHLPRSLRISRAALWPATAPTPPPGCADEPHW